jgi:hypothetical protein
MTGANLSGGGTGGGGNMTNGTAPPDMTMTMSGSAFPTGAANSTAAITTSASAASSTQNAYSGADATAAASMLNNEPTDQESFLRGTWQADADGHWTMQSVFPGWYSGRSIHFHVKGESNGLGVLRFTLIPCLVYENGSMADNGTFIAGRAMQ